MSTMLRLDCLIDGNVEIKIACIGDDNKFIGTVGLQNYNGQAAFIRQLYVAPEFRRRGIGTELATMCCSIAKENGCQTVGLQVYKDNLEAQALYSSLGFFFAFQFDDGTHLMLKVL